MWTKPLGQWRDVKLPRHCIETLAQRFRHGNTAGATVELLGVTLLAGKPDAVNPGNRCD